jgi:cytochrome c556
MINMLSRPCGAPGLKHLWLGLALAALPAAASEGDAEYREHVMASIGGHMQAAADIVQQKVPHQDHFQLHVNALAEMAGIARTLFPEGSQGGDALPAIWENPDDFAAKLDDLEQAAANLKSTVDSGGEIIPAFQQVGQACKSCHDDYRDE